MSSSPPSMSFREFLKAKAEEYGVRDRHRLRNEWLASLNRLLDQLQGWLREADPEGLLDIVRYRVSRTERGLGTYDAPAMKICLGAGDVDIAPVTAGDFWLAFEVVTGPSESYSPPLRAPHTGRVDMTDGYRKYNLFRELSDDGESWFIRHLHDDRVEWRSSVDRKELVELTPDAFKRALQDLLS